MLSEKLIEVIKSLPDSAFAIVTSNESSAHVVNSWNSYIQIDGNKLLIPASRMFKTEENLKANNEVLLTISNREIEGLTYKGTGFLIKGIGSFSYSGAAFEAIKQKYSWARAALVVEVIDYEQTL